MVDPIAPANTRPVGGTPAAQRVRRNQLNKDRRRQSQAAEDAEEYEKKRRKGRKGLNIDEHC